MIPLKYGTFLVKYDSDISPMLGGCEGDANTGASLAIKLMSPPGSSTLTPLSTLIVSVMLEGNLTEDEADEQVRPGRDHRNRGKYVKRFRREMQDHRGITVWDHNLQLVSW